MKPEIWFDIDDVLVDTSTEIHRVMLERTGKDIPVSTWPSMLFSKFYEVGSERVEEMRGWWRDGLVLERAQPFEGALEALRAVAEAGHTVGLITARAWHPRARAKTEDLVNQYQLPVNEILLLAFGESKRDLLAPRVARICSFIDDSAQHVEQMRDLGVATALVRRPWNAGFEHLGGELAGAHEFPGWLNEAGLLGYRAPTGPRAGGRAR